VRDPTISKRDSENPEMKFTASVIIPKFNTNALNAVLDKEINSLFNLFENLPKTNELKIVEKIYIKYKFCNFSDAIIELFLINAMRRNEIV
jgi:hypothetical protein